jgi:hypothetical protein
MDSTNRSVYVVTACNEGYLKKAITYLDTINRRSNVNNVMVTLDFKADSALIARFPNVRFAEVRSESVRSPNPNGCLQHGGFLTALNDVSEDARIIFTDADIKFQRPFTTAELGMLESFEDGEVGVNYNESDHQTLRDEAASLYPVLPLEDIFARYAGAAEFKTFNTGVIVANFRTYTQLYEAYDAAWNDFTPLFDHYGKQQWLLSYLIQKQFKLRLLPYTLHFHGKKPLHLRTEGHDAGYLFCIDHEPVVFNHIPDKIWITNCRRKLKPIDRLVKRLRKKVLGQK